MPNPLQIIPARSGDDRLIAFVEANGISPADVPLDSHFTLNFVEKTIGYQALVRNTAGGIAVDNEGMGFREYRTVPLAVEPHEVGL